MFKQSSQKSSAQQHSADSGSCRIELNSVSQSFSINDKTIELFSDLSLAVEQGQSYAITGPSGAGKSSLLMLLSGLENPATGEAIAIAGEVSQPITSLRDKIGFIFQQFHLLPELTALHNVALPLKLRGIKHAEREARLWLERVGLGQRLTHKPQQLSGGEQQRVAIARALVFGPKFIFADEPTGNLDASSASDVADILFSCCREKGAGLILVTHSDELAAQAQQVFALKNGHCQVIKSHEQSGMPSSQPNLAEVAVC